MLCQLRVRVGLAAVTACLLAVTACTGDAQPGQSPTPTVASSPAETQQERTARLDKEAAEQAYEAVTAEGDRLGMAGGADKPTKVITDNATGEYLDLVMFDLRALKKNGWRIDRPGVTSVTANRGWSPTEIGLTACEDASNVRLLDRSGKEVNKNRPRMFVQTLTATKVQGRWKIAKVKSKVVKTFKHEDGCNES